MFYFNMSNKAVFRSEGSILIEHNCKQLFLQNATNNLTIQSSQVFQIYLLVPQVQQYVFESLQDNLLRINSTSSIIVQSNTSQFERVTLFNLVQHNELHIFTQQNFVFGGINQQVPQVNYSLQYDLAVIFQILNTSTVTLKAEGNIFIENIASTGVLIYMQGDPSGLENAQNYNFTAGKNIIFRNIRLNENILSFGPTQGIFRIQAGGGIQFLNLDVNSYAFYVTR